MKTTFLYVLTDPRDRSIRYLGKSDSPFLRLKNHLWDKEDSHKTRWISELKRAGLTPNMDLLDEVPVSQWQFWEREYIRVFRAIGIPLTNTTNGGDGICMIRTSEHNKKIGDANRGRKLSPEHRIKIGLSKSGHPSSERQKEAARIFSGRAKSDETKKRMRKAQQNRFSNPNCNRFFGVNAAPIRKDENR